MAAGATFYSIHLGFNIIKTRAVTLIPKSYIFTASVEHAVYENI